MESVLRTRATGVWSVLVIATTISWALGSDQGFGKDGHALASVVILVVALFKVRLVGLYFMELRDAPPALRAVVPPAGLSAVGRDPTCPANTGVSVTVVPPAYDLASASTCAT